MTSAVDWPRAVLHADMDAFYASVEQRDHPELRGKPVIIGANSERGVVAAASYEARAFGVRSAMPGYLAKKLCPNGVFLMGDMKKYSAVSRDVHRVFLEFSDQIEPLALDEAFLDVTGSIGLFGPPLEMGRLLRARVLEETRLVVSVGIATSKLVAKIATGLGKPNGLYEIAPGHEAEALDPLPVRRLFGVGPKAEARLGELGVRTIGELGRASEATLREVFGRHGAEIRDRARGIDHRPVETNRAPRSIGEESTFETDVSDPDRIARALLAHSETVAARARRAGLVGTTVVLKVKLARRKHLGSTPVSNHELFPLLSRQGKLPEPGADGQAIFRVAKAQLARLALREPVRLLGVTLTGLESARAPEQLDLYASRGKARSRALDETLDRITSRFGKDAVFRSEVGPTKITASDKRKIGEDD